MIVLLLATLLTDERSETLRLAPKYNAQVEVRMPDGTRCDLLNDVYAIEVDFSRKYAESVGQATLYSIWTGRKPAVILLSRGNEDKLHILRAKLVCERLGVTLFIERIQ